jgi:molybdate transport system ATP-binding protein
MTLIIDIRHRLGEFTLEAAFEADNGVTALFGRSGSGKTSLIRIIAGLIRPDHGRVTLDGAVLADMKERRFVPAHHRRFGYVFQEARLFPHLSVRQNLNYGRWFAPKGKRDESLDKVVDLLGIVPLLDRRPGKLSGGEKQRVAIGRALLSAPRLLLMDEPLAALDEERKAEILPYLERLRDETGIPIVYVSHSISEVARLASRVVALRNGRIEAVGSPMQVLTRTSGPGGTERREAGALLEGRIESISERHNLSTVAFGNERLLVPGGAQPVGRTVRVHVPARDVMLATARPKGLSALNILAGTVESMSDTGDGMLEVAVDCGGATILSRITRLSCERLRLDVGSPVYAVIKTVALEP